MTRAYKARVPGVCVLRDTCYGKVRAFRVRTRSRRTWTWHGVTSEVEVVSVVGGKVTPSLPPTTCVNLFGIADARKLKRDSQDRPKDGTASLERWIDILNEMGEDGTIMKTCLNMKSRLQECIKNHGGTTSY